jgi:sulfur-oxidizing protein SoxZ
MAEAMRLRAVLQGSTADVRILMRHPMETGHRKDARGQPVPAHFIQHVLVQHNGRTVVDSQWSQAVAANPFLGVRVASAKIGDRISVTWTDNTGARQTEEVAVAAS